MQIPKSLAHVGTQKENQWIHATFICVNFIILISVCIKTITELKYLLLFIFN
jgi:hypothetical protein